ncbi:hypothetical protein GH714_001196 [Hevea brasiliensis]|uniref:Uncharacterized protein n=1 Tax=Hevea brasiliensis TaxID=3981 RepID=A0A6A6MXC3_HEVBR|nr:hypothetical protein GH714_001196 [Hevea brasiliensis]
MIVMSRTKQDFGSSIPKSNNLKGAAIKGDGKSGAKAEINNLENTFILIERNVMGLEIVVDDIIAVTMDNCLIQLKEEALSKTNIDSLRVRKQ